MRVSKEEVRKRKENLSPDRKALFDALLRGTSPETSRSPSIPKRPANVSLPLSFDQRRVWALEQKEPGSIVCNVFRAFSIKGPLDTRVFERCINEIIRRHEILRTTFDVIDGILLQHVAPRLEVAVPVVDLRAFSERERQDRIKRMIDEENHRSFDLKSGPLIRARLLELDVDDHVLLLNMHHIVTDCWSLGVFFRELAELYASLSEGRPLSIPELPLQYGDFAHWQQSGSEEEVFAKQIAYWKRQLEGDLPLLKLPYDRRVLKKWAGQRKTYSIRLSGELTGSLEALSRRLRVTLFMTLLAAFQWFLHRVSGQEDVLVFTPIAIRNRPETERMIGFFTNKLAVRVNMKGISGFPDLLDRVRKVVISAYENQDIPFEVLIEEVWGKGSSLPRSLSQVMFQFRGLPDPRLDLPGLTVEDIGYDDGGNVSPLEIINKTEAFDLAVDFGGADGALWCRIDYDADLFDTGTINRMMGEYQVLLEDIGRNLDPDRKDRLPEKSYVAPKDAVEIQLTAIWEKILGVSPIGTGDNFFELGGNSLMAIQLFARIEKDFGKSMPLTVLFQSPTVALLAAAIGGDDYSPAWSYLVPIQPRGLKPPFFCVHPHDGTTIRFYDLAVAAGEDQPFYGLRYRGLDGGEPALTRVEDMALEYLKEIRQIQPEGPYYLGGHCFGARVAFEMARQLTDDGEQVAFLALIDSMAPGHIEPQNDAGLFRRNISSLLTVFARFFANLALLDGKERVPYIIDVGRRKMVMIGSLARGGLKRATGSSVTGGPGEREMRAEGILPDLNLGKTVETYVPGVYPGKATLFRPEKYRVAISPDRTWGWNVIVSGGVDVQEIPGYSQSLYFPKRFRLLAERLKACLDETQKKGDIA